MSKPVFVLGVGAQKCGTTWLYQVFQRQAWADFGELKEYHVWDALTCDLCAGFLVPEDLRDQPELALRWRLQQSEEAYLDYFIDKVAGQAHVTGDITPSYSMLSEDTFRHLAQLLDGFNMKVVFLMRDPVERMWSSFRMEKRLSEKRGKKVDSQQMVDFFLSNILEPNAYQRCNYAKTIENLGRVFDSQALWFGFYESLFQAEAIASLSAFIGFPIENPHFDHKANPSPKVRLPHEVRCEAKKILAPIYDFCAQRFPETMVLWGENAWPRDS